MPNWLIDKTPLIAIQFDLLREVRVGDAVLGFLGLGDNGEYISLIPGGARVSWLPDVKEDGNTGIMIRKFEILLITPITVEICKQVAAFQMGSRIYKKASEVPYDGSSTPMKWVYNVAYNGGTEGLIEL